MFEKFLQNDAYECALWAFGKDFEHETGDKLPARWNKLHENLFEMKIDGIIEKDIEKICIEWKKLNESYSSK